MDIFGLHGICIASFDTRHHLGNVPKTCIYTIICRRVVHAFITFSFMRFSMLYQGLWT